MKQSPTTIFNVSVIEQQMANDKERDEMKNTCFACSIVIRNYLNKGNYFGRK